jgi:hypothetical protein
MKKAVLVLFVSISFLFSCGVSDDTPQDPAPETPVACNPEVVIVNSDVTTPTTWDSCHIYVISTNQISITSTLTIQPGTIIKFADEVTDNSIFVSNSGRILAIGNSTRSIVFTSNRDDSNGGDTNGDGTNTSPNRFDWGGIVINSNNCVFKYCTFKYGGEGPSAGTSQPTLEFSSYYGIIDHCTFANCGGETGYAGSAVVDANACHNAAFSITNSTFYGCIKPLFIHPWISMDNSNQFHHPSTSEGNLLNGIFVSSDANESTSDVSWTETEVPFVLTGGLAVGDGFKLMLAENVIIKVTDEPSPGFNRIDIREGSSSIQGYNLNGVVFTSYHDDSHGGDTNGNGSATMPSDTDWYGVLDVSATISTNNHCYDWANIYYAQFP